MNTTPTTEDRVWAVLSHLSALAFGMGILLPIIGWSEQKRKSKYASFQCLQALGYQSLGYTVWLLVYLVVFMGILSVIIVMSYWAETGGQTFDPFAGPVMAIMLIVTVSFLAVYVFLPMIAVITCALGRDFRYPLMGNRLAKYLGYAMRQDSAWLLEEQEDRWVAAMGHFSVIIALWGLFAPITAWIVQGKHNLFLKFQSMQTTFYQGFVNVLYAAAAVLYFSGVIALFI